MARFAQKLEDHIYARLEAVAKERGIHVTDLLRAIIIPEWVAKYHESAPNGSRDSNHPSTH